MSKYDFEIDTSSNSSTGIILSIIAEGSVVLEFGCATGRMTRYMKEVLGCQVYVVEYDPKAYEASIKYAVDGLCDDILNFRWVEQFKEIEFDAIIFADVLEHLVSPDKVLEQASKMLKPTGSIYVSVPNITHNDILLKAYSERFDYTSIGILDDSHTHFWGLENLKMLSGKYGLYIRKIEGTYCPTGYTEQYDGKETDGNLLLTNMLKQRLCGEVYQFVVTMDKQKRHEITQTFRRPFINSHIYLDIGADFNDNERIAFESQYVGQEIYKAHYELKNTEKINRVRFDPIEFQGCIIRKLSIVQGSKDLPVTYVNSAKLQQGVLLSGNDPMVIAEVLSKEEPIVIDAEFVLMGETFIGLVVDDSLRKIHELDMLISEKKEFQAKVADLVCENEGLSRDVARLMVEKESLNNEVARLLGENKCLQEEKVRLVEETVELRRDVGAYIILANNKDKYAIELENEKEREKEELARLVDYYKNMKVIRLRAFILRVLRGVWRRIKRLLGKEAHK